MEWFAVSSTYYLDPKMAGCSATTERMFTRLLAYCANAETMGFLPRNAHKIVAIPNGNRAVLDLISRKVLIPTEDGGHRFPAWDKWQEEGNTLVKRRNAEKERKRKQRAKETEMSRDMSQMSRRTEQNRTVQDNSTEVESTPHVPAAGEETRGPSIPVDGWKLVRANTPDILGSTVRSALALEASTMIRGGATEQQVADCLRLWMQKPDAGVRLLPHLLANVVKAGMPTAGTAGPATTKAQGWIEVTQDLGNYDQKAITG